MIDSKITIEGVEELQRKLAKIEDPKKIKPTMRSIATAGTTVVRKALRAVVKSSANRTGSLLDSVDAKVKVYPDGIVFAAVGVRRGARATYYDRRGRKIVPANYLHLIEYGTQPHMQPNAHRPVRVNGRQVLAPVGPTMHPGSPAKNLRAKALNRSRSKAIQAMAKRGRKRFEALARQKA